MLLEMGLIAGGIPAGWLLRRNAPVVKWANTALGWTVRIMLFFLGLSLGLDDALIGQLRSLGLYAALISTFSVTGCFLAARLLGRYVFPEYAGGAGTESEGGVGGGRGSPIALGFFAAGVLLGWLRILPLGAMASEAAVWVLYLLLVLAGMTVGFDLKALGIVRELRYRILFIPLGVVAGTLCGSALAWLILTRFSTLLLPEALAVGAGFGYYSLATVIRVGGAAFQYDSRSAGTAAAAAACTRYGPSRSGAGRRRGGHGYLSAGHCSGKRRTLCRTGRIFRHVPYSACSCHRTVSHGASLSRRHGCKRPVRVCGSAFLCGSD